MQIFTFRVPEIEQFPTEQREPALHRCIDSTDMRQLRVRWARYAGIAPGGVAALVVILGDKIFYWRFGVIVGVAAFAFAFTLVAALALKLFAEYRLIRRLLRRELHDPTSPPFSPSGSINRMNRCAQLNL